MGEIYGARMIVEFIQNKGKMGWKKKHASKMSNLGKEKRTILPYKACMKSTDQVIGYKG